MATYKYPKGLELLKDSLLNKSSAFSLAEREGCGLEGLLPPAVESIDTQVIRVKSQMDHLSRDIDRYVYLSNLQDTNETLFYKVLMSDPATYLKIVYDPTVGEACLKFGHIFRQPRGLYLNLSHKGRLKEILANWPQKDVRFIVVTDGSRILGLGDLGVNGMGIPIGKLALYTAVGAVPPQYQLPVFIDVGTNNIKYLNDSLYMGLRKPRIEGKEYNDFVDEFMSAVYELYPYCCVQYEDFTNYNAIPLLAKYRDKYCMFNDDIQGTAAVSVAAFYSANRITGQRLQDHKVLFLGAGSAASGIAELLCYAMQEEGVSQSEAIAKCWMFDTKGLVYKNRPRLEKFKEKYAHDIKFASTFDTTSFLECVKKLQPTAIIGVSTCPDLFTPEVLSEMAKINNNPLILPLSNPTSQEECTAQQAYQFTQGKALFAAGVKFDDIVINGKNYYPTQANNLWIFPAVGMAVYATESTNITNKMFLVAAQELTRLVPQERINNRALFPDENEIIIITSKVAAAVAKCIFDDGFARVKRPDYDDHIINLIQNKAYHPFYI